MKKINIHLNLGTYWTEERQVIGNTQQIADFLSVESMSDPKLKGKNYQMGYQIGSFVASFRNGLADSLSYPIIERENKTISINYYCDINTNNMLVCAGSFSYESCLFCFKGSTFFSDAIMI